MKWAASLLALAPVAFVGWFYFELRSHRDSAFGSAWWPAYGAPEWAVALALALFAAAVLYLIHGARRRRLVRLAAFAAAFGVLVLASRDLHFSYSRGEYREASLLFLPPSVATLGPGERICRETGLFDFAVVNPETGQRASFFRGVWPWSFSEDELSRLGDPC